MPGWSGAGSSVASTRPASADGNASFSRAYRKHHADVVRLATLLVGNEHDGTEVAHEALRRLHRDWDALAAPRHERDQLRATVT